MNPFYARVIGAVIRAALVAAGGASLSDDDIDKAIGAVLVIAGIAWSLYDKYRTEQVIKKAQR